MKAITLARKIRRLLGHTDAAGCKCCQPTHDLLDIIEKDWLAALQKKNGSAIGGRTTASNPRRLT